MSTSLFSNQQEGEKMSKYIKTLIRDYRNMNMRGFLDKHGAKAVLLAKKMSERQKHEQTIDNQTRFN
tara:strand:- start:188 stop:388 length:201 start_codon:yes stop_codon:yes gene_type:complete